MQDLTCLVFRDRFPLVKFRTVMDPNIRDRTLVAPFVVSLMAANCCRSQTCCPILHSCLEDSTSVYNSISYIQYTWYYRFYTININLNILAFLYLHRFCGLLGDFLRLFLLMGPYPLVGFHSHAMTLPIVPWGMGQHIFPN